MDYSREELGEFLAGLDLIDPPGIAEARHWMAPMGDFAVKRQY